MQRRYSGAPNFSSLLLNCSTSWTTTIRSQILLKKFCREMQMQIQILLNYAMLLYNTNIIINAIEVINSILNQCCYMIVTTTIIQYFYIRENINIRLLLYNAYANSITLCEIYQIYCYETQLLIQQHTMMYHDHY